MIVSTLIISYVDPSGNVHMNKISDACFDIPSFNSKMDNLFDKLINAFKRHKINDLRFSIENKSVSYELEIF